MTPRRLWRGFLVAYIIALHLLAVVAVTKTNFLLLAGKTLGLLPPEEWSETFLRQALAQGEAASQVPSGAVVLVGDSLLVPLDATRIASNAANFALGGDTTRTLRERLAVLPPVRSAAHVVIGVGVNDLKYRTVGDIVLDYQALLDELGAVRSVVVLSVLAVDEAGAAARARPYLRNATIAQLNEALHALCRARTNCRFLDASSVAVVAGAFAADGWHLAPAGARAMERLIGIATASPP